MSPTVEIDPRELPRVNRTNTPIAVEELYRDGLERYNIRGWMTTLDLSEKATAEVVAIGGVKVEHSQ